MEEINDIFFKVSKRYLKNISNDIYKDLYQISQVMSQYSTKDIPRIHLVIYSLPVAVLNTNPFTGITDYLCDSPATSS